MDSASIKALAADRNDKKQAVVKTNRSLIFHQIVFVTWWLQLAPYSKSFMVRLPGNSVNRFMVSRGFILMILEIP